MRTLLTLAISLALLGLGGCGGDVELGDDEDPAMTDDADGADGDRDDADDVEDGEGAATTISGTLAGDAQLEGGCVWVETDSGRYEVLWPDGWQADADPVQLRDPDGEVVAREGDEVRVTGSEARDVATVCQVGTPFEATEVGDG